MQRSIDYSCTVSSSVQLGKRSSQDPHVTYMNSVSVNSFLLYYQSWDTCVLIRFISSFGWKINKRLFRIWVSICRTRFPVENCLSQSFSQPAGHHDRYDFISSRTLIIFSNHGNNFSIAFFLVSLCVKLVFLNYPS